VRLLVTGGTGVLAQALGPLADAAGHESATPGREELDLFDPSAVADAVRDVDGVLHLATRIRTLDQISDTDAWRENDRLPILRSALAAEEQTERFANSGGRGVVLRFGLLDGPGTWHNVCRDGERVSAERFTQAAGWRPQP
jgi:nucleoside-diphosphate-sugar epimerase